MPDTERDVWNMVRGFRFHHACQGRNTYAVIEKVGGYIAGVWGKDGSSFSPGNAMFKFGASAGGLRMALIAANIPFEEVTPQKWQKALGLPPKKNDKNRTEWKNRLKAKAQQLYPEIPVTLKTADAILLAHYCKLSQEGKL